MFTTLLTTALLVASATQSVFAGFAINSPALTQCKDATISWEPTKGPYNLIIVKAEDPCGDVLADLGDHTDTSIDYKAALPAGSTVQLSVEDANGDEAWSGTITVAKSDDTSCIPADLKDSAPQTESNSGSTLTIKPTTTVEQTPEVTGPAPSAVGAAGSNPLVGNSNGALTNRHTSNLALMLGALVTIFAFSF